MRVESQDTAATDPARYCGDPSAGNGVKPGVHPLELSKDRCCMTPPLIWKTSRLPLPREAMPGAVSPSKVPSACDVLFNVAAPSADGCAAHPARHAEHDKSANNGMAIR